MTQTTLLVFARSAGMIFRAPGFSLQGGPYDGKIVVVPSDAVALWAYKNMYNDVKAVAAGDLPGRPTVETYLVAPGRDIAIYAAAATPRK